MSEQRKLRPRNDYVLIREERVGVVRGVAMPDVSAEGKRFIVGSVGPKVEDLKAGDEVRFIGSRQEGHWSYVPSHPGLIMTKQENVVLVIEPEIRETAYEKSLDEPFPGEASFSG